MTVSLYEDMAADFDFGTPTWLIRPIALSDC